VRMERTAAVLHAEVVMGAAIAKRARGADVNFIVDGFTPARGFSNNKNGVVVWRKKAFIVPSPHLAFSINQRSHAEPREPSTSKRAKKRKCVFVIFVGEEINFPKLSIS